jgi:hypothetical protein
LSIGHSDGDAGTLGAFVSDEDDRECILSNNHVLALMGQADVRDAIFQPGSPDQRPLRGTFKIAELSDFAVISKKAWNTADSAIATLVDGIDHESNKIPEGLGFPSEGRLITGPPDADALMQLLRKYEPVCKIGRTTGLTEGRLSAIALDNVPVKTSIGNLVFNDVLEITWKSKKTPFSQPGDSGSLVFTKKGFVAVGLHFASGSKRKSGREIGVSYSCNILAVFKTHNISLLD